MFWVPEGAFLDTRRASFGHQKEFFWAPKRVPRGSRTSFSAPEGFLFGYFETLDRIEKILSIEDQEINKKWQDFMAPYFENIGNNYAEKRIVTLEEVFHTD